jgi:hypothetical protein
MLYTPASFVIAEWVTLVPVFVATIRTFATTAPLASVTVPVIEPVMVCAGNRTALSASAKLAQRLLRIGKTLPENVCCQRLYGMIGRPPTLRGKAVGD